MTRTIVDRVESKRSICPADFDATDPRAGGKIIEPQHRTGGVGRLAGAFNDRLAIQIVVPGSEYGRGTGRAIADDTPIRQQIGAAGKFQDAPGLKYDCIS